MSDPGLALVGAPIRSPALLPPLQVALVTGTGAAVRRPAGSSHAVARRVRVPAPILTCPLSRPMGLGLGKPPNDWRPESNAEKKQASAELRFPTLAVRSRPGPRPRPGITGSSVGFPDRLVHGLIVHRNLPDVKATSRADLPSWLSPGDVAFFLYNLPGSTKSQSGAVHEMSVIGALGDWCWFEIIESVKKPSSRQPNQV